MRELPTIESVAKATPSKIHKLWEGLGYYTRARNLQKAARQIVINRRDELHESQTKNKIRDSQSSSLRKLPARFPETFEDVLALPGIGRYTAGAICSIAFNQPTPILDGNVIRVLTRIFGIAQNPKEKKTNQLLWQIAEKSVAQASCLRRQAGSPPHFIGSCSALNQSLMELGALICAPRNPQCEICPVKELCIAFKENRVEALPRLGKREVVTARRFAAFIIEREGKFLIRQRPAGIVNALLWEFPNVEIVNGNSNPKLAAKRVLKVEPTELEQFHTLKHSITRYRITLDAFRVQLKDSPPCTVGLWKTPAQIRRLAFTAAHKKLASFAIECMLSGQ